MDYKTILKEVEERTSHRFPKDEKGDYEIEFDPEFGTHLYTICEICLEGTGCIYCAGNAKAVIENLGECIQI